MRILITAFDDFEEIELIAPIDILRRSNITFEIFSFNNRNFVQSKNGIKVPTNCSTPILENFDAIFIHGGAAVQNMRKNKKLLEIIKHFKTKQKHIFAICDAPNLLFENGIIEDENYTSYPIQNLKFGKNRNDKSDVVLDNKLLTAKGPGSAIKFGIKIVELIKGKKFANQISTGMVIK